MGVGLGVWGLLSQNGSVGGALLEVVNKEARQPGSHSFIDHDQSTGLSSKLADLGSITRLGSVTPDL